MKTIFIKIITLTGLILTAFPAWAADSAPNFELKSIEGASVGLADYKGQKNVVINFWASWCESCKEEIGKLMKLKSDTSENSTIFLAINVGDSDSAAKKFMDRYGFGYKVLMDRDKSVTRKFGISGIPQTWVISRDGKVLYQESVPPQNLKSILSGS